MEHFQHFQVAENHPVEAMQTIGLGCVCVCIHTPLLRQPLSDWQDFGAPKWCTEEQLPPPQMPGPPLSGGPGPLQLPPPPGKPCQKGGWSPPSLVGKEMQRLRLRKSFS